MAVGGAEQALSCGSSQVPAMTSLEGSAGRISRSGVYSSEYEAFNAFDATASLWLSAAFETPAWLQVDWFDCPRTITGYAVKFANGSSLTTRAPKDWTLEGYDGSSWVVVDSQANQTGWLGVERRAFVVAAPGSYGAYRFNITDDNDARPGVVVASIDEFELFACDSGAGACSSEPTYCGARAGNTCTSSEYCAYREGEDCGASDGESICLPRPESCPDDYRPVCACNHATYANSCEAARAGFGVLHAGVCG